MELSDFTEEQLHRYARHIVMPEVGGKGQIKLLESRVLVVGAGGLGAPLLMYLAAAGVGTLGVVDNDRVELSNLQRQVIHVTSRIGVAKTESARSTIEAINPGVGVRCHTERLEHHNALGIISDYDLVCDGSDNFATRYLVNDACHLAGKPLVSAAMMRFDGQLTTFPGTGKGPCYRCLFPEMPPRGPGSVLFRGRYLRCHRGRHGYAADRGSHQGTSRIGRAPCRNPGDLRCAVDRLPPGRL